MLVESQYSKICFILTLSLKPYMQLFSFNIQLKEESLK